MSSPTVKRRRLAAELHICREEAGLTIDDVAGQLEWSAAKISRIENAQSGLLAEFPPKYGETRKALQVSFRRKE